MSQVKNLRAMFENKGDTSPPDERGRSLGVSTPSPTPAGLNGSPRPLSKVRTNFVAVERNGQIGLRREHSLESERRRMSNGTDTASTSNSDKAMMASIEDVSHAMGKLSVSDTPPMRPAIVEAVPEKWNLNSSFKVEEETSTGSSVPADATTQPSKTPEPKPDSSTSNGAHKTDKAKATAASPTSKTTTAKTATKAPVKAAASKATTEAPKKAVAKSAHPPVKRETSTTARASTTALKTTSTTVKKPQPIKTDNTTGFVRPKVKSPTKPVNLPSSLMAPTASSVSKVTTVAPQPQPRQSNSRQSLSRQSLHTPNHSSTTVQSIRRQNSTIGHARPSLGPPPKKSVQEPPKKLKEVDEDFLARMMRPTQASSSKTAEKPPSTPPKKATSRPSLSGTDRSPHATAKSPPLRKLASKDLGAAAKKPIAKAPVVKSAEKPASPVQETEQIQSSVETLVAQPDAKPEPEPVKEIVTETAKVDTAEEVADLAHQADLDESPVQPNKELESEPEPTEEVAPEVTDGKPAEEVPIPQEADVRELEPVSETETKEPDITDVPEESTVEIEAESTLVGEDKQEEEQEEKTTGESVEEAVELTPEKISEQTKPEAANGSANGHATTGETSHTEANEAIETA